MSQRPQVLRFGMFEFDLDALELRRQGTRVPIEPQPARALTLLLQRAGEVVSRDDLKKALWKGDVNVDFDRGLAYVMGQVRSALGDSADNPRFVETLPKRGFRFIAPVAGRDLGQALELGLENQALELGLENQALELGLENQAELPRPSFPWLKAGLAMGLVVAAVVFMLAWRGERPMLAIAIFDNETGQPEYDQPMSGMADAVIGRLGKLDLDRLGVIGNARSLRMPRSERDLEQIKSETGASFILISVLQRQDSGTRLISQLIRLSDGRHVWVKRFDRPPGNLEGLEREVLDAVELGVRTRILDEAAPSPVPPNR